MRTPKQAQHPLTTELNADDESIGHHEFGGAWTVMKLEAVQKYLSAYAQALKNKSFTKIYIDAFAGTGRCDIKVDGQKRTVDGSASRALDIEPPFHKYYFIERDRKKQSALRDLKDAYPGRSIDIMHSDANVAIEAICKKYSWRKERAVLFLDPYGMELAWETLVALSNAPGIDIWYLFPYSGLYRQATKSAAALDAGKEAALDRILGTREWRDKFYAPPAQKSLFGEDIDERQVEHTEMLQFVSERLGEIFTSVTGPKILYQSGDEKNPRGSPLFALYFLLSNPSPKAIGVATNIASHILKS